MVTDARSPNRNYPIPNIANNVSDEFPRQIVAIDMIDTDMAAALTSIAGKAALVHAHAISDITGLSATLASFMLATATFTLAGLTDVSVAGGATASQVLKFNGTKWQPGSVAYSELSGQPSLGSSASLNAGSANGVAQLDSTGKVPSSQLPAFVSGALVYQGTWNATTNTPTLVSSAGTKGFYYKVSNAGSTTIDGINQWNVGDTIVFDGTTWDKLDGVANEVVTVAGLAGAITSSALKTALGITWTDISGKPTTLAGYGITDALGKAGGTMSGPLIGNNWPNSSPANGAGSFAFYGTGPFGGGFGLVDGSNNIGLWSNAGALKVGFATSLGALSDKFSITPIGNVDIYGGVDMHYQILSSSGSSWFVGNSPGGMVLHNVTNTDTVLTTNSIERIRIQASGNVILGQQANSSVGMEFGSQTTATNPYFDFRSSGTTSNDFDARIQATGGNTGASGQAALNFTAATFNWYGPTSNAYFTSGTLYLGSTVNSGQATLYIDNQASSGRPTIVQKFNGTEIHKISADGGQVYIDVNVGTYGWYFGGSQKAYIDNSGNLSVSGTVYSGGVALAKTDVGNLGIGCPALLMPMDNVAANSVISGTRCYLTYNNGGGWVNSSTLGGTWRNICGINLVGGAGQIGQFQRVG